MKLVKTISSGWATTKYYDLGKTSSKFGGGFDRKILVVTLLETGQETKSRYRGSIEVEVDGNVVIETAVKPYSEKMKGFDY